MSNFPDQISGQSNGANDTPILQVEALTKQVDSVGDIAGQSSTLTLLQDISFTVNRGESIALIGPSGSGKSTLLGLLAGLDDSTSGRVLINGNNILALNEDARAKLRGNTIGFVFQSFQLLDNMTAIENVMLPLELNGQKNPRALAETILERVGLVHRLEHYPKQLSGGEQQRVAIARAFVITPMLLLADEPTGNLDHATGKRIIDLLYELNREQGTTLVLVTHDDSLAQRCDKKIELVDGQLRK